MAGREEIRIDIFAEDRASEVARYVADVMEDLEAETVEVDVTADTTQAEDGLRRVKGAADGAEGGVRKLGDSSDQSRSVLANLVGNSAQDLGEFGGVAGTAGVAVGQLAEYAADGNIAISGLAKTAGPMLALGAAVGFITDRLTKARQRAEQTARAALSIAEALREGDAAEAASTITEEFSDLFDAAEDAGLSTRDLSDFLAGNAAALDAAAAAAQRDIDATRNMSQHYSEAEAATLNHAQAVLDLVGNARDARDAITEEGGALDTTASRTAEMTEALHAAGDETVDTTRATEELTEAYEALRGSLDVEGALLGVQSALDNVESATADVAEANRDYGASSEEAQDANRDLAAQLVDAKQDVIDYAEQVGNIPPERVTDILAMIDRGDLAGAEAELARLARTREATIKINADLEAWRRQWAADPGLSFAGISPRSVAPSVTVNVNVPQGSRPDDVIAAATRYARRNGGTVLTRGRRR